jgi:hypothetical protein
MRINHNKMKNIKVRDPCSKVINKTNHMQIKCNNHNIHNQANNIVIHRVEKAVKKVKVLIHNILKVSIQIDKCKLEDGNGLIQLFKVLVLVQEVGIQLHYLELLL